ncbi:hypothetical protein DFAR_1050040 [Desulfarculales bacterium]
MSRSCRVYSWVCDLFQHHCHVTVRGPRVDCPDHGTKQVKRPWTREGS